MLYSSALHFTANKEATTMQRLLLVSLHPGHCTDGSEVLLYYYYTTLHCYTTAVQAECTWIDACENKYIFVCTIFYQQKHASVDEMS